MSSVSVCNTILSAVARIVGISTIARTEHSVAQTRELHVLPQVLARGQSFFHIHSTDSEICTGLQVTEVAHNIQQQVSKYVVSEGLTNSYDTWHGKDYNYSVLSR